MLSRRIIDEELTCSCQIFHRMIDNNNTDILRFCTDYACHSLSYFLDNPSLLILSPPLHHIDSDNKHDIHLSTCKS